MTDLKMLLSVLLSEHLSTESPVENFLESRTTLLSKLAYGIATDRYKTDKDALTDLYGQVKDLHALQILKSKLKKKALASLLLKDIVSVEANQREATKHQLSKSLAQANLLLQFGARTLAIKVLKRVVTIGSTFELNDIVFDALGLLKMHYWYIGDQKSFSSYREQVDGLLQVLTSEHFAESSYQEFSIPFVKSKSPREIAIPKIESAISVLDSIPPKSSSFVIVLNTFKLKILLKQIEGDPIAIIRECSAALLYLKRHPHLSSDSLLAFLLLNQCEAFEQTRLHRKILELLPKLRVLIKQHNPNRLAVERLAAISYLHCGEYGIAEQTIHDAMQLPYYQIALPHQKEDFIIYQAYLELIQYLTGDHLPASFSNLSDVRRKTTSSSKDKLGNNIHLIILKTLQYVISKDYNRLTQIDKILDNYLYRYLRGEKKYSKAATFFTMLRIVIREDLNKNTIQKKSAPYYNKLIKYSKDRVFEYNEIIFYEILWDMLLLKL